jgi:hypothetical protein
MLGTQSDVNAKLREELQAGAQIAQVDVIVGADNKMRPAGGRDGGA